MESTRSQRNLNSLSDIEVLRSNFTDCVDNEIEQKKKPVPLRYSSISVYHETFHQLGLIGTGKFGSVYKCISLLDGSMYAIKKGHKLTVDSRDKLFDEVFMHAKLKHQHIVQYYSSWMEDQYINIQREYCNGGSLVDWISHLQKQKEDFWEPALRLLLLHVAEGLKYMHSRQIVHLDIKPGNIFIFKQKCSIRNYDSTDDDFAAEEIIYKIGNLGHATSIESPQVEKGDCRYLPTEMLSNDFTHLPKADIFALGLTVYEAGGGGPLPEDGPTWYEIRQGKLKQLAHCSCDFNDLLKLMIHPDPEVRPSAESLIDGIVCPRDNKIKWQLRRELNEKKLKNEKLLKQFQQTAKCLKIIAPNVTVMNKTMNTKVTNVALPHLNITNYHQILEEVYLIGTGKFGSVYKWRNPVDYCFYIIKKSIKLVPGSIDERNILNEVSAHAKLRHQHIVYYCSAWMDDNHIIIQNECCDGSLAVWITRLQKQKKHFCEPALRLLLLHVAEGLKYMHSKQLVHLNIKPENIFICKPYQRVSLNYNNGDDDFFTERIIYKIGNLSHVTSINNPQIEKSDCRYLPTEIMYNDFTHLPKADIFALGLTVYEACGGGPLPKDGPAWAEIRQGKLKKLVHCNNFNDILKLIHRDPEKRPSAVSLIQHLENKTKAELRRELYMMKLKNEILSKELQQMVKCSKIIVPNVAIIANRCYE